MKDFMHTIEGISVTKYYIGTVFVHNDPATGKTRLCKLTGLHELLSNAVLVEYYDPAFGKGMWHQPTAVKCSELHWYRKPNFTAADLLK